MSSDRSPGDNFSGQDDVQHNERKLATILSRVAVSVVQSAWKDMPLSLPEYTHKPRTCDCALYIIVHSYRISGSEASLPSDFGV